ncbi:MAG: ankyrin repeat domain-containing protein [Bryobacteraceae bacterium]
MKRVGAWVLLSMVFWSGTILGQYPSLVDAAGKGDIVTIRALLAGGADPNAADNSSIKGWTPLMSAAKAGSADAIKALLKANANVNAMNEYGGTALDIAISTHGRSSDVAALIYVAGGKGRERDKVDAVAAARATIPNNNTGASEDARSLVVHVSKIESSAAIQRQSQGFLVTLNGLRQGAPESLTAKKGTTFLTLYFSAKANTNSFVLDTAELGLAKSDGTTAHPVSFSDLGCESCANVVGVKIGATNNFGPYSVVFEVPTIGQDDLRFLVGGIDVGTIRELKRLLATASTSPAKTLGAHDAEPLASASTALPASVKRAEMSDGVTVKVQQSRFLSHFQRVSPTSGFSWSGNGVAEGEDRKPQPGRRFLALQLAVQNSGRTIPITLDQIILRSSAPTALASGPYAPFYWEKALVNGISESRRSVELENQTVLNVVVEVPELNPEKLVLWFLGRSRGSLESLGMKGNQ